MSELVKDPSRCEECNRIRLTEAGILHIRKEFIDIHLSDNAIRKHMRDDTGVEDVILDFDAYIKDVKQVICHDSVREITDHYLRVVRNMGYKKVKKDKRMKS